HSVVRTAAAVGVAKEVLLVLYDRPSGYEAELVAPEVVLVGVLGRRRREEVPRVQGLVAEELERRAVQLVGPRLRAQVDDAAVEASELGGRRIGHDLELLDGGDDGGGTHGAGLRLEGGAPGGEGLVHPGAGAAA